MTCRSRERRASRSFVAACPDEVRIIARRAPRSPLAHSAPRRGRGVARDARHRDRGRLPDHELPPVRLPGLRVEGGSRRHLAPARRGARRGRHRRPGRAAGRRPEVRARTGGRPDPSPRGRRSAGRGCGERPARLGVRARRTLQRLRGRRLLVVPDRPGRARGNDLHRRRVSSRGRPAGATPRRGDRHGATRGHGGHGGRDRRGRSGRRDRHRGAPERGLRRAGCLPLRALCERGRRRRSEALPDGTGVARVRPAGRSGGRPDGRPHRSPGRGPGRPALRSSSSGRGRPRTWSRRASATAPRSPSCPPARRAPRSRSTCPMSRRASTRPSSSATAAPRRSPVARRSRPGPSSRSSAAASSAR